MRREVTTTATFTYDFSHLFSLIEPQDPTPQPQQPQPLPFNSCEEFVMWLGNLTTAALVNAHTKNYGQRLTARILGSDLAEIAYFQYDRHINNRFAGFRPELVNAGEGTPQGPQGAGVYGHILLNAGLRLIEQSGDPGGAVGFHLNRFKDWGQAVVGSPQYQSERAGNLAGRTAGDHLWNYVKGSSQAELEKLRRLLCQ